MTIQTVEVNVSTFIKGHVTFSLLVLGFIAGQVAAFVAHI